MPDTDTRKEIGAEAVVALLKIIVEDVLQNLPSEFESISGKLTTMLTQLDTLEAMAQQHSEVSNNAFAMLCQHITPDSMEELVAFIVAINPMTGESVWESTFKPLAADLHEIYSNLSKVERRLILDYWLVNAKTKAVLWKKALFWLVGIVSVGGIGTALTFLYKIADKL